MCYNSEREGRKRWSCKSDLYKKHGLSRKMEGFGVTEKESLRPWSRQSAIGADQIGHGAHQIREWVESGSDVIFVKDETVRLWEIQVCYSSGKLGTVVWRISEIPASILIKTLKARSNEVSEASGTCQAVVEIHSGSANVAARGRRVWNCRLVVQAQAGNLPASPLNRVLLLQDWKRSQCTYS